MESHFALYIMASNISSLSLHRINDKYYCHDMSLWFDIILSGFGLLGITLFTLIGLYLPLDKPALTHTSIIRELLFLEPATLVEMVMWRLTGGEGC